ncbi:hypothetical protein XENOCAPTIV_013712, partial [Xenoophorus captivus]
LLKFCTVGFCGIGTLIDFILIAMQVSPNLLRCKHTNQSGADRKLHLNQETDHMVQQVEPEQRILKLPAHYAAIPWLNSQPGTITASLPAHFLDLSCPNPEIKPNEPVLYLLQIVGPADGSNYIVDYYGARLTRLSITNETYRKPHLSL